MTVAAAFLLAIVASGASPDAAAMDPSAMSRGRIITSLKERAFDKVGLKCTCHFRISEPIAIPDGIGALPLDTILPEFRFESSRALHIDRGRLQYDSLTNSYQGGAPNPDDIAICSVWDGQHWVTTHFAAQSQSYRSKPTPGLDWGLLPFVYGVDLPSSIQPHAPLSEVLSRKDVSFRSQDHEYSTGSTFIVVTLDSPSHYFQLVYDSEQLRFPVSGHVQFRNPDLDAVVHEARYEVTSWRDFGHGKQPHIVRLASLVARGKDADRQAALQRVQIVELESGFFDDSVSADSMGFPVPGEGWTLKSPDLRTVATIGERTMRINGVQFPTANVILGFEDILDGTVATQPVIPSPLLNNAAIIAPDAPPDMVQQVPDVEERSHKILFVGLTLWTAIGIILVWLALRTQRSGFRMAAVATLASGVACLAFVIRYEASNPRLEAKGMTLASSGSIAYQDEYDFGRFQWAGAETIEKFEVELYNTSSAPVRIDKVATSCGCTRAIPRTMIIEPGKSVVFDVSIKYSSPGKRTESIRILAADEEVVSIAITATPTTEIFSIALEHSIDLQPSMPSAVHVFLATKDDVQQPAGLTIDLPDGVDANPQPWSTFHRADPEAGVDMARWVSVVELTAHRSMQRTDYARFYYEGQLVQKVCLGNWPW